MDTRSTSAVISARKPQNLTEFQKFIITVVRYCLTEGIHKTVKVLGLTSQNNEESYILITSLKLIDFVPLIENQQTANEYHITCK
jgi:hypothetical protein